jgi:hypothetical protein
MNIEINLDNIQKSKLVEIIEKLYKSNSIDSESLDDFLKLTIFIVLFEYDKDKESLLNFYKKNRNIYKKTNSNDFSD